MVARLSGSSLTEQAPQMRDECLKYEGWWMVGGCDCANCQKYLSQTGKPRTEESFPAQDFILAQDSTPQRNKLIDTIRTLDEYETTILQAYANNLIKSRGERA